MGFRVVRLEGAQVFEHFGMDFGGIFYLDGAKGILTVKDKINLDPGLGAPVIEAAIPAAVSDLGPQMLGDHPFKPGAVDLGWAVQGACRMEGAENAAVKVAESQA